MLEFTACVTNAGSSAVPLTMTDIPNGRGVAERFDACIVRQLNLCVKLEVLADSLPARVDTLAAMRLVQKLESTLKRCHELEEAAIFPILRTPHSDFGAIVERLRVEHLEDESQAADLREAVSAYVARQGGPEPEGIGYMLRGLFTPLRRHLAFDREFVLPMYLRCGR